VVLALLEVARLLLRQLLLLVLLLLVLQFSLSLCLPSPFCPAHLLQCQLIIRDSRKSQQKWQKNTADFCKNRKNHGKNTAKTRHQITGPNNIIQSIKCNI